MPLFKSIYILSDIFSLWFFFMDKIKHVELIRLMVSDKQVLNDIKRYF